MIKKQLVLLNVSNFSWTSKQVQQVQIEVDSKVLTESMSLNNEYNLENTWTCNSTKLYDAPIV